MVERILTLLKERKLSPSQFADEIGIQRSGMSHLISGRNKPSLEFVMKVLQRFPDVTPEWLLYGTSEPDIRKEDELSAIQVTQAPPVIAASLFDNPAILENKQPNKQQRIVKKENPDHRIEKIVIFYDDRTFREYEPEK